MGIALDKEHLQRYRDVGMLLIKYGQVDFAARGEVGDLLWGELRDARGDTAGGRNGSDHDGVGRNGNGRNGSQSGPTLDRGPQPSQTQDLAADLERLGPTFVKLGQLLALRPDLLPPAYIEALSHVGEHLEPVSIAEARQVLESELGASTNRLFASFQNTPISVSAFGQTHQAVLLNNVRAIVKVQRREIRKVVLEDLDMLEQIVKFYAEHATKYKHFDLVGAFNEIRKSVVSELDYRQEAHNLKILGEHLKDLSLVEVPAAIEHLCSARVLTTTFIEGKKVTAAQSTGLLGSERTRLAQQVFRAFLQQVLVDGFVNARPNPDKVLVTNVGKAALLDLGSVARISASLQDKILQILVAINDGKPEHASELIISIGKPHENFDALGFRRDVGELVLFNREMSREHLAIGKIFLGLSQVAIKHDLSLPSEIPILGSALQGIDDVVRHIDPRFDSDRYMHETVSEMVRGHVIKTLSPSSLFHNLLEAANLLEQLPLKVGRILDALANNELKVTVRTIDEKVLISGFQKIANRITCGLVLAALIIGAAMLMRVPTSFSILGYPGLAMLCFIVAAGCGFMLVAEILISDRRAH